MQRDYEEADLKVFGKLLKKRLWLIVLVTLLCVGAAGVVSYILLPPVYEAGTVVLLTQVTDKTPVVTQKDDLNTITNTIPRIPVLTMSSYLLQIKSDALMSRVIAKLNLEEEGYTPRGLAGQVRARADEGANLIEITVSSRDPVRAAEIANTLCLEFVLYMNEKNRELMDQSIAYLRNQRAYVAKDLAGASMESEKVRLNDTLVYLDSRIAKTQVARSIDLGSTNLVVISAASIPEVPVRPRREMNMAVALVLGLFVSIILAVNIPARRTAEHYA
ncbi:YveK family protein [Pelotomaculum propionicicum]|uniref:YveK family protein n=1 Tax=Pelotomaculum propionicicum TaxID=258475 RepID=UPI003B7EDD78